MTKTYPNKWGPKRYHFGETRRRCERMRRIGLPCRMWYEKRGNLHSLRLLPRPGWTHLTSPAQVRKCIRDWGPYHVTLALDHLLQESKPEEQEQAWEAVEFLRALGVLLQHQVLALLLRQA